MASKLPKQLAKANICKRLRVAQPALDRKILPRDAEPTRGSLPQPKFSKKELRLAPRCATTSQIHMHRFKVSLTSQKDKIK